MDSRESEIMKCKICEGKIGRKVRYNRLLNWRNTVKLALPYFDPIIPTSFDILKRFSRIDRIFKGNIGVCRDCGHGAMENPPDQKKLSKYYLASYWNGRSYHVENAEDQAEEFKRDPRAINQVQFIMDAFNGVNIGSMLEIGSGAAFSSIRLRDQFGPDQLEVFVCEPGLQWDSYYQKHGLKKIASTFPFVNTQKVDFILTSHWLEHMIDVNETVERLREMIESRGFIFVEVPNTDYDYWDLPRTYTPHVQFFTRDSLKKAFETKGFSCVKIGEAGLTYMEKHNGIATRPESFGPREKGMFLRAVFRRTA